MKLTWYTANALVMEDEGHILGIDPFIPMNDALPAQSLSQYDACDAFLITHGHFDHTYFLPAILKRHKRAVYASGKVLHTLRSFHVPRVCLHQLTPGEHKEIAGFEVHVFAGKHIEFDPKIVWETLSIPNMARAWRRVLPSIYLVARYPEYKETQCYLIQRNGWRAFVMGSMSLRKDVIYPKRMDLLILPYQGSSHLLEEARKCIFRLEPKAILLSHFDDAFPPVTRNIRLTPLLEWMQSACPDTALIVPKSGEPVIFHAGHTAGKDA